MKIVSIGDEHARGKFISIYNKLKDDKSIDYFVCMGDYFDPYRRFHHSDMYNNFNEICNIARKDKRVILLIGNHDIHYLIQSDRSRYDSYAASMYKNLFISNRDLLHLCFEQGEYIWSHAGICEQWLDGHDIDSSKINEILDIITGQLQENKSTVFLPSKENEDISNFVHAKWSLVYDDYHDYSGWGDSNWQSCVWTRPPSLVEEMLTMPKGNLTFDKQIVGHTRTDVPEILEFAKKLSGQENLQLGDVCKLTKLPYNRELILVDTGDNENYLTIEF